MTATNMCSNFGGFSYSPPLSVNLLLKDCMCLDCQLWWEGTHPSAAHTPLPHHNKSVCSGPGVSNMCVCVVCVHVIVCVVCACDCV